MELIENDGFPKPESPLEKEGYFQVSCEKLWKDSGFYLLLSMMELLGGSSLVS